MLLIKTLSTASSLVLPFAAALPSKRNNITSVYTTTDSISVYTIDGSRVGCLDLDGRAISSSSLSDVACAAFTSVKTEGYVAITPTWFTPSVNYTIATSKGFCGVTLHNGDSYAAGLNQDYGHIFECTAAMPLYEAPNSGYANIEYSSGVNALIGKLTIGSGYASFNEYWNTVGGVALNSTPAVTQAVLPDYSLGPKFAFVPEFEPDQPQQ